MFLLMGIGGAFLTGDAFNLFVFFEVLLIASYGLMVHGGGGRAPARALQYVAFNLIGSSLFLIALGHALCHVTGTLNMADLARSCRNLPRATAALLRTAAVLLFLVFAVKGALVPLHFWLPGTYANAPGRGGAVRDHDQGRRLCHLALCTLVFPPDLPATGLILPSLLLPAALVTLGLGAIGTLGATTLPRLAAFAGIASMGTVFLGIAQMTPAATSAALYYLIHSTLATALVFLVADLVSRRRAHLRLDTAAAIARPGPIGALYFAAAIALAGLPPLSGFLGKLMLLDAWRDQAAVIWPAILVSSFLMLIGLSRAGSLLFWKASTGSRPVCPA
jgi:multicomponent K+:H+ antiporter subunit D